MAALSRKDIQEAKLDPRAIFRAPQEVVASRSLSREQKRDILAKWRQDEIALDRAEGEGMDEGAETGEKSMLRQVEAAIDALDKADNA